MSSYALEARQRMLSNAPPPPRRVKVSLKAEGKTDSSLDWDINPLALPRGKNVKCETCNKDRCKYHCPTCRVTFYCCKEHRETDYRTIHKEICSRIDFLNHPKHPVDNGERIRVLEQHKIVSNEIVSIAKGLAEVSIFEGRPQDALRQLKAAFQHKVILDGPSSVNLMGIYALYIEAYIKVGDIPKAEEQLRKAEQILMDEGEHCSDDSMANFYKNEGLFNLANNNFPDALLSFSNEVYFATKAYHQEHPRVATGLLHLSQTFLLRGMHSVAFSHFLHATEIWLVRLDKAIKLFLVEGPAKKARVRVEVTDKKHADIISGEQMKDSWSAMQFIYEHTVREGMNLSCLQTAKITCATGMTEYLYGNHETAADMAMKCKIALHDCKCPVLLDMVQDLYRASLKGMKKKDFKGVTANIKSMVKLRRGSSTNLDLIKKFSRVGGERKRDSKLTPLPQLTEEKPQKRPSIFGNNGYTIEPAVNNDTTSLFKVKGRGAGV